MAQDEEIYQGFKVSFQRFAPYYIFLSGESNMHSSTMQWGGINVILVSMVTYIKECEESKWIAKETACELSKDQQVDRVNPIMAERFFPICQGKTIRRKSVAPSVFVSVVTGTESDRKYKTNC